MSVPARISLVTLGVDHVPSTAAFYERLGWQRSPASVEGEVAFFDLNGTVLAIWGRAELAADANATPGTARDPGSHALAINVESPAAVDALLETAAAAGATILKPGTAADWGGYTGYFADPAGHWWEVGYNPGWPLDADGRVQLP